MIYDCFTFFNELDLLELRLEELKDVVDRFVLVEATKTFSNRPKVLTYNENKDRFKQFHDKIIHIIVDDLPEQPKDSWENQYFQRNAISRGLVNCTPDDIIIISDLDEIPRASAVAGFQGEIAFLEQNLYYYRLNCLCTTAKWAIPVILRHRNLTTPQEVRMYWYNKELRESIPTITNGGWHFSYLGDVQSIQLKLNSFSQQDFNTPEVNNKENIEKKIDAAEDLFNRPQYQWTFVKIDQTYPDAIYHKKYRYAKYLQKRDLESTIFFDQYSRYKACADILEATSDEDATILDVGSGTDCLLGDFLPGRNITFVDPLIAKLPEPPTYMLAGDPFCKDLDGRIYDYVVSIDTLEHIPSNSREAFITRLSSLARKGIVIAFPACDAGDATGTDQWINSVYKEAYGRDYCWLEEHIKYGLPSLREATEQLQSLGWQLSVFENGHTPWVRDFLSFTLCSLEVEALRHKALELSEYFNRHLHRFDCTPPGYRQIVIATRESLGVPLTQNTEVNLSDAASSWEHIRLGISAAPYLNLLESAKARSDQHKQLTKKSCEMTNLIQLLADRDLHVARLEQNLAEVNYLLSSLRQDMIDRNKFITSLEVERDSRDHDLAILTDRLQNQTQQMTKLGEELTSCSSTLHNIIESKSWRITAPLRKAYSIIEKLIISILRCEG